MGDVFGNLGDVRSTDGLLGGVSIAFRKWKVSASGNYCEIRLTKEECAQLIARIEEIRDYNAGRTPAVYADPSRFSSR